MQNTGLKVSEIFRSIQGEGLRQGRPCTFVRLAGCNLRCRWCDTKGALTGGDLRSPDDLFTEVKQIPGSYVCITGGEPLLQEAGLIILLRALAELHYTIDIETNGTISFTEVQKYAAVCMDIKCPSSGEKSMLGLLKDIRKRDCVKFVVADIADCCFASDILNAYRIKGECFVSPVYGSDYRGIAEYILEKDLPVRLQLQLHRIIGVA